MNYELYFSRPRAAAAAAGMYHTWLLSKQSGNILLDNVFFLKAVRKVDLVLMQFTCSLTRCVPRLYIGSSRVSESSPRKLTNYSLVHNNLLFQCPKGIILQNLIGQVNFCLGQHTASAYK